MNKLNHHPRKTLKFKTLHRYFLLAHCNKPDEHQDCTSELNTLLAENHLILQIDLTKR
jgi:hypothetical protein